MKIMTADEETKLIKETVDALVASARDMDQPRIVFDSLTEEYIQKRKLEDDQEKMRIVQNLLAMQQSEQSDNGLLVIRTLKKRGGPAGPYHFNHIFDKHPL
jgi:hypothetical protein